MYYSALGILAAVILIIENLDILTNRKGAFGKPAWRLYRRFLISVLFYYASDILWGILEKRKLSGLLFADTTFYYIFMALSVMFCTQYIVEYLDVKDAFGKVIAISGRIFAAVLTGLSLINIFAPVLFTVDAQAVYYPLTFRYVMLIVQIGLLVMMAVYALSCLVRYRDADSLRRRYRTISVFALIMAAFLFAQIWNPLVPLYTLAYMLSTCIMRAFVIGDEKEEYRLGLEKAEKVAALQQSIKALIDNMPALTYSKDIETGAYIACNQAFADYACKASPSDITGLTDHEVFDREMAAQFAESDRKALEADEPYSFDEDVRDGAGRSRVFETTKLKFHDNNGKLCLLGMSRDITEMEKAKEAYRQVLSSKAVYENIMDALARDYFNIYYIDLKTDDYIEYGSRTGGEHPETEKHGKDFFAVSRAEALKMLYEDDKSEFIEAFEKEKLIKEIREDGTFILQYRIMIGGVPTYVSLKATMIEGDENHMIIGINNVDAQMKDRIEARRASEEQKTYRRISALSGNLLALYLVDTENDTYKVFSTTSDYEKLGLASQGEDFFRTTYRESLRVIYPDDLNKIYSELTEKNVTRTIERDGSFVLDYRIQAGNDFKYARLKAAKYEEDGKDLLIIGVSDVDARVRSELKNEKELSDAKKMATSDALTGAKNKHAYVEAEAYLNKLIEENEHPEFAIVVCDVNDLKTVNDTQGHAAGDAYIKQSRNVICGVFKNSPVFRVGGDEFAVICQGHDYEHIDELMEKVREKNRKNRETGGILIAVGMARFDNDRSVGMVFERADKEMYMYKMETKMKDRNHEEMKE